MKKNVYLTSYGIDTRYTEYMNCYDEIIEVLKNKKVAIIPNAKLKTQNRDNSYVALEELNKHGIQADIIDLDETELENFDEYDAMYLSGGEPKYLMDAIINNGYYEIIKLFIESGNEVIGQSAGAMIMSKVYADTSEGFRFLDNGFDFCDKVIVPHYNNLSADIKAQFTCEIYPVNDYDRLDKLK